MSRLIGSLATAVLLLTGCGDDTATTETADSYERYLDLAPDDAPYLTPAKAERWLANACQDAADGWDHSTAHSMPGTMEHALIRAYGC